MGNKGIFIAFEGIDGSGKSSQIELLHQKLVSNGYKVYNTFEPTDNRIGSMIRAVLKGEDKADQRTIAVLFAADRLHHLLNENDGIIKKLSEGYIVLCDRFYFSSYAYHSVYMEMDWVIEINQKSTEIIRPDLHIFIDVDPKTAMARIQKNRTETELYETFDMLKSVYSNYQLAFEKMKNVEQIVSIDGNQSIQQISEEIYELLEALLH